jgi:hypothetical protein
METIKDINNKYKRKITIEDYINAPWNKLIISKEEFNNMTIKEITIDLKKINKSITIENITNYIDMMKNRDGHDIMPTNRYYKLHKNYLKTEELFLTTLDLYFEMLTQQEFLNNFGFSTKDIIKNVLLNQFQSWIEESLLKRSSLTLRYSSIKDKSETTSISNLILKGTNEEIENLLNKIPNDYIPLEKHKPRNLKRYLRDNLNEEQIFKLFSYSRERKFI